MYRLTLIFAVTTSFFSFSQEACTYCRSMEDALLEPSRVTYLDLSAQSLTQIPDEINELENLQTLDLRQNLIDRIDFESVRLEQLRELTISNNPGFDAFGMDGIASALPKLEKLNLSSSSIRYLSNELAELPALKLLDVSNNSVSFLPNELTKLTHLDASNNNLTDVNFLIESWDIEYLDISGNLDLSSKKLGKAIAFKDELKELAVSPDSTWRKSLPTELSLVGIKKLTIKKGLLTDPNFQLTKNDSIETIVFEDVKIESPMRLRNWLNRFEALKTVEFVSMTVPEYLDEIVSVEKMRFTGCDFEDKMELREVKSTIKIEARQTDIRTEGYIGNSKIVNLGETSPIELKEDFEVSPDMASNSLDVFVRPESDVFVFEGARPKRVEMDFTSFDIPSEAFLTQSGQLYTGEVKVQITEYMDPVMNALSGVPMTFRGDSANVIFSSSGMFDFRAFDTEGNALNPNPENPIEVEMNDLMPSEDGQLYQYNDEMQNWEELDASPTQEGWMDRKRDILDSLNKIGDVEMTNFYTLPVGTYFKYKKSRKDPYIISFETLGTKRKLKKERRPKQMLETANPDERWVTKQKWKIDTVVDPSMMAILAGLKSDQRKIKKYWGIGFMGWFSDLDRDDAPRFLRDLAIVPDLKRDNYRMTFKFKGKPYSFPVIQNFNGSVKSVQTKEKKSFAAYQKDMKQAAKEEQNLNYYTSTVLKKQAELLRERTAAYLAKAPSSMEIDREYLRFGLGGVPRRRRGALLAGAVVGGFTRMLTFGLVNVDKPIQLPPEYIAMDAFGTDQNGEQIDIPPFVRTIYVDNSGYASVPSYNVPMPRMRKAIVMFRINPSEIAVVRDWERLDDGKKRPSLERVEITDLSPGEIRSVILGN